MALLIETILVISTFLGSLHFSTSLKLCDYYLQSDNFDHVYGWNTTKCELHTYDYDDVVECFDQLSTELKGEQLHFAFVGDSRIRQAFHSFWPMIPDYDLYWNGEPLTRSNLAIHLNMNMSSPILNTGISFRWRPVINVALLIELKEWLTSNTPTLIVTGFSSHHMEQTNARNYIEYEEWLTQLAPVLEELSKKTTVVWLHQNPIIETYGNKNFGGAILRSATNQKYDEYNIIADRILKNTGVFFWRSNYLMAGEYVRSCTINDRTDRTNLWACFDFIHTGYLVVDRGTQVLFNAICNHLLPRSSHAFIIMKHNRCCAVQE